MARGRKRSPGGLAEPGGPGVAVTMPEGMTAAAARKWSVIVPLIAQQVALKEADADALRQYCEASARRDRALAELEAAELVLVTPNGAHQINPLLTIADKAESVMMKLSERFGLDPASRKRLQLATESKGSRLAEFLASGGQRRKPPEAGAE